MLPRPSPLILTLGLLACNPDSNLNILTPVLVAAPTSLEFGGVVVPYDAALELQLINAGRATLEVSAIEVASRDAVYTISPAVLELAPDESAAVLVTFEPATYLDYGTELLIQSNDPEAPVVRIPIVAEGIDGPVPELDIDPVSVDFGTVVAGSTTQSLFTLRNTGTGPLEILPESGLSDASVFRLISDPAGRTISPGGDFPVIVEYTPTTSLGDWSRYTVQSNDPLVPSADVLLIGNGGGEYNYPVAVIDAEAIVAPLTTTTFDGTGSYDPEGYEPLNYAWTLIDQPTGSQTSLSDGSASAPSMFIDAAGTYTLVLQVENTIGVKSEPATHIMLAQPEDELYILLSWNTGNSDLDLHLLRDDPANWFVDPDDACYCNPNPNWGESGSADDPVLALDNRVGYGPENINIESPADGEYYIRVHYYQDLSGGTTEATVSVFLSGELVDSWSRVMSRNQIWDVAVVNLPEGLVTPEATDNYSSTRWDCE